jgi:hypothetical protein
MYVRRRYCLVLKSRPVLQSRNSFKELNGDRQLMPLPPYSRFDDISSEQDSLCGEFDDGQVRNTLQACVSPTPVPGGA